MTSEELHLSRKRLFDKLGDTTKPYCQLMKQWFSMRITKEDFDLEARKLMNPEETRLHNEFLLCLLNKCAFVSSVDPVKNRINGKKAKSVKQKRSSDKGGFQPADPVNYLPQLEEPPLKLQEDAQRYSIHDYFLPDHSFILGRLMLGAWELGMKGADDNAADCLVAAVQVFLKNVLTATVTMRKGFKIKKNRFIHSIGRPVPNPWLRNSRKRTNSNDHGFMDVLDDSNEVATIIYTMPAPPPRADEIEQQEADAAASAVIPEQPPRSLDPISTYDLLLALTVHKSTVPSHSIYAHNMERMICALDHPTWEQLEAAKHIDRH